MGHKTDKRLEHAEHTKHAAHDDFDRKVSMSMAILAASLAFVTMQSHRAHNDVIVMHNEANRLDGEANILLTRASNSWNHYQFWATRKEMYRAYDPLLTVAEKSLDDDAKKKTEAFLGETRARLVRYDRELGGIQNEAKKQTADGEILAKKSLDKLDESEGIHHRANRLDYGGLGLELALVICSLAVLTKRKSFWLVGVALGVIGFGVAMSSYAMSLHHGTATHDGSHSGHAPSAGHAGSHSVPHASSHEILHAPPHAAPHASSHEPSHEPSPAPSPVPSQVAPHGSNGAASATASGAHH